MKHQAGLFLWAFLVLLAACQISPRRIVNNTITPGVSPTPTPSITPTPTPGPTVAPTATPTPTPFAGMSFVFTSAPGSQSISGTAMHPDGSRAPVPGSPFLLNEPAQQLLALGSNLLVRGRDALALFAVDKQSGMLRQTDQVPVSAVKDMVVSGPDATVFILDTSFIFAYRLQSGRMIAQPGTPFALPSGSNGLALSADSLALAPDQKTVLVEFSMGKGAPQSTFGKVVRTSDGALSAIEVVDSVTSEVAQTFAAKKASAATQPRLAAVVTP